MSAGIKNRFGPKLRALTAAALFVVCLTLGCGPAPQADLSGIHESQFPSKVWPAVKKAYTEFVNHPDDAEANGVLAMVLHSAGKYEDGERYYRRAIEREPSFRWLYYLSQLQTLNSDRPRAIQSLRRALEIDPDYVPARLKLARLLVEAEQPKAAEELLTRTVELDPESAVVEFELGQAKKALRRDDEAIGHFERACELLPEFGAAQYALAVAYRDRGRATDAAERFALYKQYEARQPTQSDPLEGAFLESVQGERRHLDLAEAAVRRGDLRIARREYQAVLDREPDNVAIRSVLIAVHYKLSDLAGAERMYREATKLNPGFAEAHYHWGMVLLARQRSAEAEQAFARAIEAQPTYAEALTQFGLLREKGGDVGTAIDSYRKALASQPSLRQAQFLLGRQLIRRREYDQGIALIEKTVHVNDATTPWFLRALAGAHAAAGRPAKGLEIAKQAHKRAVELGDQKLTRLLEGDVAGLEAQAER